MILLNVYRINKFGDSMKWVLLNGLSPWWEMSLSAVSRGRN